MSNWNVLSGADKVRAYANNAADAGVQTTGYDEEILKEQRRRRDRDTFDEVVAAQRAKQRRAYEAALAAYARDPSIYKQDRPDEPPTNEIPLNLKSNEQRDFERGYRDVGNAPLSALGRNIVPTLRDIALTAGEFINPLDWANIVTDEPMPGTYGYVKQQARQRDLEGMSPQQRGEYSGVAGMADMGITAASLPFMAQGAASLVRLAKDAAMRKMINMHNRFRTVPVDVDLGPMRDVMSSPLREATLPLPSAQYAALPATQPEMDTTRWTDLMKDINRSIDEVNTPTRIPRPRPQRGGINPSELERLQPDLGDAANVLDRINEGPRRAAAQFKVLDPWGNMVDSVPTQFAGGGSVAGMARRLAQRSMPMFQEGASSAAAPLGALSVVKPKGGNWLNGSVEEALRGLKTPISPTLREDMAHTGYPIDEAALVRTQGLNNWIEGPLTKYVKTRMASPEDEVRRLAEQGVLHTDVTNYGNAMEGRKVRSNAGMPMENTATTELGRGWEDLADSALRVRTPSQYISAADDVNYRTKSFRSNVESSLPWLRTIDTKTKVYSANPGRFDDLGFYHLTDELRNALDPNSDLPRHLQLTPDAVKNMSMEKAVRRVADINAWRAEQAALAENKNAEELLKRDALRTYDDQWRWLSIPDTATPEGLSLAKDLGCRGGWCTQGDSAAKMYGSEGSRLHVLIDHEGRPHAQIQVEQKWNGKMGEQSATEPTIAQIKPPENVWSGARVAEYTKRNPEYKSRVQAAMQDFVKNPPHGAPWGDVGDLQNTDLRRTSDAFNAEELKKIQEAGIDVHNYVTMDDIMGIGNKVWPGQYGPLKYASGGSVSAPREGWDVLTDPTPSPTENKLSWDVFSGHNDPEQLEAA